MQKIDNNPWLRALLACLPIVLWNILQIVPFHITHAPLSLWGAWAGSTFSVGFLSFVFFRMVATGRTDRFRLFGFVFSGICTLLFLHETLLTEHGKTSLNWTDLHSQNLSLCMIPVPTFLVSFLWDRTIIFPGELLRGVGSIGGIVLLVLLILLILGRGWCSWVCPYGIIDSFFSRLFKKPLIRIDPRWTLLPFAILLATLVISPMILDPFYCRWLCPVKLFVEHETVYDLGSLARLTLAITFFAVVLVTIPILSKKRSFCGFYCPLGAFLTLTARTVPFSIRIRPGRCNDCGLCVERCPTLSWDRARLKTGLPQSTCSRCGHCVDHCPSQAIAFHVAGTKVGSHPELKRILWLTVAYGFGCSLFCRPIATIFFDLFRLLQP